MKHYLIADRYARSLNDVIEDDAQLEPVLEALRGISQLFSTHHELHTVIANPAINVETRIGILNAILERGETAAPLKRLLATLVRRGRITVLPDVAELFSQHADARLKRVGARVTSAMPLTESQAREIAASLESYSGMHVRIEHKVDPELLGGVTARIGSTVIDGSIRARIERLKQHLLPEEKLGG